MTEPTNRYWDRAQRYLSSGQLTAARIALESLLQRDSAHVPARLTLSGIALAEDRVRAAASDAIAAAAQLPTDEHLIVDVAEALRRAGETRMACECLDHPALAKTNDGQVLVRLGNLHKLLGQHPEALAAYERAAAAGANSTEFQIDRALALIFNGCMTEAAVALAACLRSAPFSGGAALALARLRKQTQENNHLGDLQRRLEGVERGSEDHAAVEFARYKELEDLGRYDEAWDALAQGNAVMYGRQRHDSTYLEQLFEGLIGCCTPQLLQPDEVVHEGPQPIFILGMPRSGTTLLERVLGNHSQVVSAGELDDFGLQLRWMTNHRYTLDERVLERLPGLDYAELGRRYLAQTQWRAQGARFFIDKLPTNWMVAGLIRRALPQARILNLVRDPMDVCFSNFRVSLGDKFPWSYDLRAIASYYLQYRRLLAHWHAAMPGQILDVAYADLVRDPEATVRQVFAHCGLEWERDCVDISRNKSAVATLSVAQVREGIHTRFFEEWRHYERQLQPLREALAL